VCAIRHLDKAAIKVYGSSNQSRVVPRDIVRVHEINVGGTFHKSDSQQ